MSVSVNCSGSNQKRRGKKASQAGNKPVRKPFGGKGGRKKRERLDPAKEAELKRIAEDAADEPSSLARAAAEHPVSNFFYSDEKWIAAFEDEEIMEYIRQFFPCIDPKSSNDQAVRREIVEMLSDEDFMTELMSRYSMTVLDFFKLMYRTLPMIFRGMFVARVQKTVRGRKYAELRTADYAFRRMRAAKGARRDGGRR